MKRLHRLLNIREGEGRQVFILFTYFFFFGATLTVSKTARDAYFVNRFDVSYLPLMFIAAACVVALIQAIHGLVSKWLGSRLVPLITLSGIIFAVTLILIQSRLYDPLYGTSENGHDSAWCAEIVSGKRRRCSPLPHLQSAGNTIPPEDRNCQNTKRLS